MIFERRDAALDELAAPLGALLHNVNNALAVISTTAFALQMEDKLSDADAEAILGGIEAARVAFADFEPIVRSRGSPEVAVPGAPQVDLSSSITALTGRPTVVRWEGMPPRVTDLARATRRLIAVLWSAADELGAAQLLVTSSTEGGRVLVSVRVTTDGRVWGPVPIGVPV